MAKKTIVDKIVVGTPIGKTVNIGFDSADVIGIVDSDYVRLRETPQDFAYSSLTGAPTALSSFTNDTNFITSAIFDSPITLNDLETTGTSVIFNNLPTTDPLNSGQLWRDSSLGSVLRVSTGVPINIDVLTL